VLETDHGVPSTFRLLDLGSQLTAGKDKKWVWHPYWIRSPA
jgi:hypothetical protein